MILSKDNILGAPDLNRELVEVPEWGGAVYIQTMTAADRDEYELSIVTVDNGKQSQDLQNMRAKLVARCMVDEDGNRIIDEVDVIALGKKSAKVLDRLFEKASELNGMSDEDIEAIAKN